MWVQQTNKQATCDATNMYPMEWIRIDLPVHLQYVLNGILSREPFSIDVTSIGLITITFELIRLKSATTWTEERNLLGWYR